LGTLLAAASVQGVAAAAATVNSAPPPFPKGSDVASVARWMKRYAAASPATAVALSDDVVYALLPYKGKPPPDYARAVVDAEVIRPAYVKVFGGRSAKLLFDIDCKAGQLRLVSLTVYPSPNLKGRSTKHPTAGEWVKAPPASTLDGVWSSICDPSFVRPLPAERAPGVSKTPGRK
jgi:hypothetical protein